MAWVFQFCKNIFIHTHTHTHVRTHMHAHTHTPIVFDRVIFPLSPLLCYLYWTWGPLLSLEYTPVSVYVSKQVDCNMCRFSSLVHWFSFSFFFFSKDGSDQLIRRASCCCYIFLWLVLATACLKYRLSCLPFAGTFFSFSHTHTHTCSEDEFSWCNERLSLIGAILLPTVLVAISEAEVPDWSLVLLRGAVVGEVLTSVTGDERCADIEVVRELIFAMMAPFRFNDIGAVFFAGGLSEAVCWPPLSVASSGNDGLWTKHNRNIKTRKMSW